MINNRLLQDEINRRVNELQAMLVADMKRKAARRAAGFMFDVDGSPLPPDPNSGLLFDWNGNYIGPPPKQREESE